MWCLFCFLIGLWGIHSLVSVPQLIGKSCMSIISRAGIRLLGWLIGESSETASSVRYRRAWLQVLKLIGRAFTFIYIYLRKWMFQQLDDWFNQLVHWILTVQSGIESKLVCRLDETNGLFCPAFRMTSTDWNIFILVGIPWFKRLEWIRFHQSVSYEAMINWQTQSGRNKAVMQNESTETANDDVMTLVQADWRIIGIEILSFVRELQLRDVMDHQINWRSECYSSVRNFQHIRVR